MTAETSNARGEWVLVPRRSTDDMHRAYTRAKYEGPKPTMIPDLWDAMLAAAPPAAARGDVRRWHRGTDGMAVNEAGDWVRYSDYAALAAEGVQAGAARAEAEVDALRVLLHEAWGHVPSGRLADRIHVALTRDVAIASALSQQPEARGCRCIDCGGDQPGHDPSCTWMRDLHGEGSIPRLPNGGRYTATDNSGQHYYLNHANTWQTFQGVEPEARGVVDEVWMFKGAEGDWHTFIDENHRLNTIDDGRWEVRKFAALTGERNG